MVTTIKTWEEFNNFCKENSQLSPKDFVNSLFSKIDLDSDFIHHYEIKIKGDNFHSSITTGYAASLIDLQDNFYKLLLTLSKGNIPVRKSKNLPQMSFTVTDGCSILKSEDLINSFKELVSEFRMLTPVSQTIIAVTVIGCFICNEYFDYKKVDVKTLKEVQMAKLELEKYKTEKQDRNEERKIFADIVDSKKFTASLEYASQAGKLVRNSFIKNTPVNEVESIKFPTETLTKSQIIDEQKTNLIEKRSEIKTLDFKVLNLAGSFSKQKLKARAQLVSDPSIVINLSSELLDEEDDSALSENDDEHLLQESDIDILWDAQKHNKTVSIMGNFFYDQENKLIKGAMWSISRKEDK